MLYRRYYHCSHIFSQCALLLFVVVNGVGGSLKSPIQDTLTLRCVVLVPLPALLDNMHFSLHFTRLPALLLTRLPDALVVIDPENNEIKE